MGSDEGQFRPDLYYRLGVFAIHLPDFLPELAEAPVPAALAAPPGECFELGAFLIRPQLNPDARDLYVEPTGSWDRLLLPCVLGNKDGNQHLAALLLGIARKHCARNSENWACAWRTRWKPTKTTYRRADLGLPHSVPTGATQIMA